METIINGLNKAAESKTIGDIRDIMDAVYAHNEANRWHSEVTKAIRIAHRASQVETAERCKIHIQSAIMMVNTVIELEGTEGW